MVTMELRVPLRRPREIGSRLITFGRSVHSRSIISSPSTIHKGKTKKNNSIHSSSAFPFIGHVTAGGRRKLSVPIVVSPPRSFWSLMWAEGQDRPPTPHEKVILFSLSPLSTDSSSSSSFPPRRRTSSLGQPLKEGGVGGCWVREGGQGHKSKQRPKNLSSLLWKKKTESFFPSFPSGPFLPFTYSKKAAPSSSSPVTTLASPSIRQEAPRDMSFLRTTSSTISQKTKTQLRTTTKNFCHKSGRLLLLFLVDP